MLSKDYYQILQVSTTSTTGEIKKAYRRLAFEFHPDKNRSQWATDQFALIQEAYQVLSNPSERKKYDAARFFNQQQATIVATSPEELRMMCDRLVAKIKKINPDNINRDKLVFDLEAVLSVYHIQLLEKWNDVPQNRLIIESVLYCLQYADWADCMKITHTLTQINGLDAVSLKAIASFLDGYKKRFYWNRYKIWVALLIAVFLCFLIYLS